MKYVHWFNWTGVAMLWFGAAPNIAILITAWVLLAQAYTPLPPRPVNQESEAILDHRRWSPLGRAALLMSSVIGVALPYYLLFCVPKAWFAHAAIETQPAYVVNTYWCAVAALFASQWCWNQRGARGGSAGIGGV